MVKNDLIAQLSAYNGELALIVSRQAVWELLLHSSAREIVGQSPEAMMGY
jgi:hypothetical protein